MMVENNLDPMRMTHFEKSMDSEFDYLKGFLVMKQHKVLHLLQHLEWCLIMMEIYVNIEMLMLIKLYNYVNMKHCSSS